MLFFLPEPEHKPGFIAGTLRQDLNIQTQSGAPGRTQTLFQFKSEQQMLVYLHRLSPHRLR